MVNKRVDTNIKNDINIKSVDIKQLPQYSSPDENDQVITTKQRKNKAIVEKEQNNKVHEIIVDSNNNVTTKTPTTTAPSSPKSKKNNENNVDKPTNILLKAGDSKDTIKQFTNNLKFVRGAGIFMFLYYCAMMYVRFQHRSFVGFADTLWLCNLAVVFGFISIAINKPLMLGIACNCTLIVHFLWVVDVIWYFCTGVFPLGNAEYIVWPDITWGEIITTTHHAWFVPLSMLCLHRNGAYPSGAWLGSISCIIPVVYLSQLFPRYLPLADGSEFYLNINMSHEWWKDMKGWPFSLIPSEGDSQEYYIFLFVFSIVLFSTAHFCMKAVCSLILKKR